MPKFISNNGEWVEVQVKSTPKATEVTVQAEPVKEADSVEVEMPAVDETITYNELDVNRDGKVDNKDASIAGKVLNETKKKKATARKKNSKKKSS